MARHHWTIYDDIFNGEKLIGSSWKGSTATHNWGYSLDAEGYTEVIEIGFDSKEKAEDAAREEWHESQSDSAADMGVVE